MTTKWRWVAGVDAEVWGGVHIKTIRLTSLLRDISQPDVVQRWTWIIILGDYVVMGDGQEEYVPIDEVWVTAKRWISEQSAYDDALQFAYSLMDFDAVVSDA